MPYRIAGLPRGDMARGGFFGNVFRAVTGVVGGAVGGFIKGGPIGGIAGALGGAVGSTITNVRSDATEQVGGSDAGTPHSQSPEALVRLHQLNVHKAHAGGKQIGIPPVTAGGALIHPGGTVSTGRRHRRIRWTNPKALGRAERRIHMAVKHMTRYIKWVHPHKKGRAFPHFGRRKK